MGLLIVWVWMTSYGQWVPTQVVPVIDCTVASELRQEYQFINGNPRTPRVRVTCHESRPES